MRTLPPVEFVERFFRETPAAEMNPPELIDGGDLIGTGLLPGPQFKDILDSIRDRQLDGEITTRKAALAIVNRIASDKITEENP